MCIFDRIGDLFRANINDMLDRAEDSEKNGIRYSNSFYGGGRFLGYRLIEKIFPANCPVYVLGEWLRMGDRYIIEKAHLAKKPSILSYKSEDQIVQDHKKTNGFPWQLVAE